MHFVYTPYVLPLLVAATISLMVAVYAWVRRSTPGALVLSLMSAAIFIWVVGYSFEITGLELETKYSWGTIEYIGVAYSTYGWLIFSILYSGHGAILSRRFIALTILVPTITVLLALTTKWHGLIWSAYYLDLQGDFVNLSVTHGLWFWIHLAYSYAMLLVGTVLFVRVLWRRHGMYCGQVISMLIAVLAPWVGNILYFTGNSPIPYLDLTPFALTITVVALAWAIFGFRLVDITPLARDRVVDSMREGMIVLDARANIVDINNAAARMIGVSAVQTIGRTAADVFSPWSHLVERFRNVTDARDEFSVGEGAAQRRYKVRLSPLQSSQGQFVGRLIMLRALEDEAPKPDLTLEMPASSQRDQPVDPPEQKTKSRGWLIDFFFVPEQNQFGVPPDINPAWYRMLERNFTIALRIGIPVLLMGTFFTKGVKNFSEGRVIFFVFEVFLLFVGLARNLSFFTRATISLFFVYAFGFIELFGYGQLPETFLFFIAFVVGALLAWGRKNGITAVFISLGTLLIFWGLTNQRLFVPLSIPPGSVLPFALTTGFASTFFIFISILFGLFFAISSALDSSNRAWYKESQTANLLQQERNLLEQRVAERTRELVEARDSALRNSAELRKYHRAIEQSGNSIVITNVNGDIEYVNPKFTEVTGYALHEVLGENPRILKSGRQIPAFYQKMWATLTDGQVWHGVFNNKKRDGSYYWESVTIAPVLNQGGVITNYVAIKDDITARRLANEQLQRLSHAVEQSGNTVIMLDQNGLIEYVNPKFVEVTGYSVEEALGKPPVALMNGAGSNPDFSQDEWWLAVNAGKTWRGEFKNHHKNGSVFWESAIIAPVISHNGELINFVEIKQDITEQKIMQDQLQTQNDYLSILHQMTLDLLNRRELNDLLQVIVDRSAILLDAPYSQLLLLEGSELVTHAVTGNLNNLKGDRVVRGQANLSWQAFDTQQPVVLEDYAVWEHRREIYDSVPLHATADFPIIAGGRCLGILSLGRSQPDYKFTATQVETGILFTRLVALVLDNASLYQSALLEISERQRAQASLQSANEQQQVINFLLKIALEDKTIDQILEEVLNEIFSINWLKISFKGGIFLFDEKTNQLNLRVHRNFEPFLQVHCSQIALGQCLCGRAALTRQAQSSNYLDSRHKTRCAGIEEHGHYNVPILQGKKILGVLVLHLPHGYLQKEEYQTFMRSIADVITVILRRKQAESLLLDSEVRFRQIVENASDIIYRADVNGYFTYANSSALNVMGFVSEADVLGRSCMELAAPEFRHDLKRIYDHQYLSKTQNTYYEFPVLSTDGRMVWVGQNVQLIMDGEQITGFQAVARDITQLKQAQEALSLSRDQALDASRFKSQLLSRVSHELRTPLNGVLGYAELLQYNAFGSLNEEQHKAVNNIIDSANYLTAIVSDLLDESQIESQSLSLYNEYFNPVELVEKTKATMSVLAAKKGLGFHVNIGPNLPTELYGDVNRLQQILINLEGNAIKFTQTGEIIVSLNRSAPTYWTIEVHDTGAGIPLDYQKTIFEPFYQVNNSITRENRGSGLGLAITKQLVELMGGSIHLESEIGKGSLFIIALPIINAPGE